MWYVCMLYCAHARVCVAVTGWPAFLLSPLRRSQLLQLLYVALAVALFFVRQSLTPQRCLASFEVSWEIKVLVLVTAHEDLLRP